MDANGSTSHERILPRLSILSDRLQLRPTQRLEAITQSVASTGLFDVGWDDVKGVVVSAVGSAHGGLPLGSTALGRLAVPASSHGVCNKPQSSLTFSRQGSRPQTSNAAAMTPHSAQTAKQAPVMAMHSNSKQPHRLSQSLEQLIGANHATIPSANLAALGQPGRPQAPSASAPDEQTLGGAMSPEQTPRAQPVNLGSATSADHATSAGAAIQGAAVSTCMAASEPAAAMQSSHTKPSSRPASEGRLSTPSVQNMSLGKPGLKQSQQSSQQGGPVFQAHGTRSLRQAAHPMARFKPSRAQALMVFNALDQVGNGRLTLSDLEEACICLGFSVQQSRDLFDRLDIRRKGFLTPLEWGSMECFKVIEMFTLLYMRRFMGLPDTSASDDEVKKYFKAQQLKMATTLPAAINLVRVNAVLRGSKAAASSGNVIYDAFRFIDTDSSGMLSKDELKDGFSALGVNISDQVADQVMELFDSDKSGTVEYHEFVKTLFPKSNRP